VSEEQGFLLKMPSLFYALHGDADGWMRQLYIPILSKSLHVWTPALLKVYYDL
jgi:hypothetical protein